MVRSFHLVGFPDKPQALVIEMDQNNETSSQTTIGATPTQLTRRKLTRLEVLRLRRRARRARERASVRAKSNVRTSERQVVTAHN